MINVACKQDGHVRQFSSISGCIEDGLKFWSCHIVTKRWGRAYEAFTLMESVESGRCHCFWMKQNSEPYAHLVAHVDK